jgi:hypothetical protein
MMAGDTNPETAYSILDYDAKPHVTRKRDSVR